MVFYTYHSRDDQIREEIFQLSKQYSAHVREWVRTLVDIEENQRDLASRIPKNIKRRNGLKEKNLKQERKRYIASGPPDSTLLIDAINSIAKKRPKRYANSVLEEYKANYDSAQKSEDAINRLAKRINSLCDSVRLTVPKEKTTYEMIADHEVRRKKWEIQSERLRGKPSIRRR